MLVNVGKAEVELVGGPKEGAPALNQLARFMIGGLWVTYRMTYAGAHWLWPWPVSAFGVTAIIRLVVN